MKTTILGGILFLAPIAALAIILGKVFQISMMMVEPFDQFLPSDKVVGVAVINVVAVLFILLFCYVAGYLAQRAFLKGKIKRLDGFLVDLFPGYAVFTGVLGSASSDEDFYAKMKPVFARFDDYDQIAFEIERGETHSVLFLPGAPSAWSGSAVVVENQRIRPLDMSLHQATKLLRSFGRGSLAISDAVHADRARSS